MVMRALSNFPNSTGASSAKKVTPIIESGAVMKHGHITHMRLHYYIVVLKTLRRREGKPMAWEVDEDNNICPVAASTHRHQPPLGST